MNITIECFNCHGFKESIDYILTRLHSCDIMCLSETWIKPSELSLIQDTIDSHVLSKDCKYVVFNKCGMSEDDEHSAGRPYGGVAVICKVIAGLTYELINCDSKRVAAVMTKDTHGKPVHLILSVYMPFYNGSNVQREEFLMCIDTLQVIIDNYMYGEKVPIKLLGDFNVQLPRKVCNNNWYK